MESAIFKLCVFGNGGVGKTTLINRYINGRFSESTKMTIGVDITTKHFMLNEVSIKLQIWDFGGEERFRFFLPGYARGAFGGIFIYDITRYNSILNLNEWLNVFDQGANIQKNNVPILMVGTKLDMEYKRNILIEEAENYTQKYDIYNIIECSSKTGENIDLIFEDITSKIIENTFLLKKEINITSI